jgi:hypothetical protein
MYIKYRVHSVYKMEAKESLNKNVLNNLRINTIENMYKQLENVKNSKWN